MPKQNFGDKSAGEIVADRVAKYKKRTEEDEAAQQAESSKAAAKAVADPETTADPTERDVGVPIPRHKFGERLA